MKCIMFWTLMCLSVSVAYGLDLDYLDSPLRGGGKNRPCNRVRRAQCRKSCGTKLAACLGDKCYCVSLKTQKIESDNRSALRHHIAHFCPNLDEARKCIFKCMKYGKPAFCGKDHVCYCGHRYTAIDDDTQYNPKEAYSEFKDLYLKYFGPNYADGA